MATQTAQRTAKRVLLGHEIAYLRNRLGMSQTELGKAIGKRQNKIAYVELGQAVLTVPDLQTMLDALQVTEADHRAAILEMHADSHRKGEWTTGFMRAYGENVRLLVDLERHADQIFYVTFEIVPGILQHEEYVRSLCARKRLPRGVTADDVVLAWKARQEILTMPDAPTVQLVLSESCLRRKWGSPEIMRLQMAHLIKLSQLPTVQLQVLTFDDSVEDLSPLGHGFTMLRVPSPGRAGNLYMSYNEGVKEMYYRDDPKVIDAHEEVRAATMAAAQSPEDSRKFIDYISGTFL